MFPRTRCRCTSSRIATRNWSPTCSRPLRIRRRAGQPGRVSPTGCSAVVERVLEALSRRPLDILTTGLRRFELLSLDEGNPTSAPPSISRRRRDGRRAAPGLRERALDAYQALRKLDDPLRRRASGRPAQLPARPEYPGLDFATPAALALGAGRLRQLVSFCEGYIPKQQLIATSSGCSQRMATALPLPRFRMNGRLHLIFDADDTLWRTTSTSRTPSRNSSNSSAIPPDRGGDPGRPGRNRAGHQRTHGYGALNFGRNLRQCYEHWPSAPSRATTWTRHELRERILDQPVELMDGSPRPSISRRPPRAAPVHQGHPDEQRLRSTAPPGPHFSHAAIVHERTSHPTASCSGAPARHRRCWMIGNSPRSDINPALGAGPGGGLYPPPRTWSLEREEICHGRPPAGPPALPELRLHFWTKTLLRPAEKVVRRTHLMNVLAVALDSISRATTQFNSVAARVAKLPDPQDNVDLSTEMVNLMRPDPVPAGDAVFAPPTSSARGCWA